MRFIVALRLLLGATGSGPDVLMEEVFKKDYYPDIDKLIDELETNKSKATEKEDIEKFDKEIEKHKKAKEDLEELIENNTFDRITKHYAISTMKRIPKGKYSVDDLIADFTLWLMKEGTDVFKKYVVPEKVHKHDMTNLFSKLAQRGLYDITRNMYEELSKEKTIEKTLDDKDFGLADLFEQTSETEQPFEKEEIKKIREDLINYIRIHDPKGKKGVIYKLFQEWLKMIPQVSEGKGILLKDIIEQPEIAEFGLSMKTLDHYYQKLKKLIVSFFEKERGMKFTEKFKKQLSIAASDNYFRVLVAKFVLTKNNDFMTPDEFAIEMANKIKGGDHRIAFNISEALLKLAKEIIEG